MLIHKATNGEITVMGTIAEWRRFLLASINSDDETVEAELAETVEAITDDLWTEAAR